jgi:multiple sugar transport system permease protein
MTAPAVAAPPAARRRRRSSPTRRREWRWALLFLSPWIVGFVVFTGGPMLASLWLSFTAYDVVNPPQWVGLANYERMMSDPDVALALSNTVVYTLLYVPLSLVISLGLAVVLRELARGGAFFRTVFYLPSVTPPVAVGVLFLLLLNGQTGLINETLGLLGIDGPGWTTDPAWVKPGIVILSLWSLGTTVIIYLAALGNVPEEYYDAARVDGTNAWQRFRHVTMPMISGAVFFTLVVNTIASLQLFAEVYTMYFGTATSTSANDAALFYVVYLFQQAFRFLNMGYASALAWLLFLVVLVITLLQLWAAKRFVHYERV